MTVDKTYRVLAIFMICALFLSVSCSLNALASSGGPLSKEEARKILSTFDPDLVIISVEASPVKNLWEVVIKSRGTKGVTYIDSEKKFVFSGNIIDVATKENLTGKKYDQITRVDISRIPLDRSLTIGDPGAEHKVIIFTDPDCHACRKFHQEIKSISETRKDIVFFLKLFPLNGEGESYQKIKTILCEKSNEKAILLLEDAYAGKDLPPASCNSRQVDENIRLAEELDVSSTPTIIFSDGRMRSGAKKAKDLLMLMGALR